jgi:serine phosphatase RsbU (regulator of sigma subunit)/HAMP domain-containing protein
MSKVRFTVPARLYLGFGTFITILLIALYFVQTTLTQAEKVNDQLNNVHLPSLSACRNLLLSIEESLELSKQWTYVQRNEDHEERRNFTTLVSSTIPEELKAIDSLKTYWSSEQQQEATWIHQEWDTLQSKYVFLQNTLNSFDSYQDPFKVIQAEDLFLTNNGIPVKVARLQYLIKDQLNHFHQQIQQERGLMNASFDNLYILLGVLSALTLFLGFGIAYITSLSITKPIRNIRRILKKLSFGVYSNEKIEISNDEIGDMAIAANKLIENFKTTKNFASALGQGNFDIQFSPLSDQDEMGKALIQMKGDLFSYRNAMEERVAAQTNALLLEKNKSEDQLTQIERLYADLKSSINYAKRLQDSILPSSTAIQKLFPQHFILFLPKDVVSGDFYWIQDQGNKTLFAAADCTGHGVPGAFMSLIAHNALNHVTKVYTKPGQILNQVNRIASAAFNADEEEKIKDGMDIALCSLDRTTLTLEFSGAQNPLYIIRDKELIVLDAEKRSIGSESKEHRLFASHTFQCQEGDMLYLFSDGLADQFGGPNNKKFMRKRMREMLMAYAHENCAKQKDIIQELILNWKGQEEQTDDILLIGVRI